MQKITPFLWFDNNAEEVINFYVSIFKNSKIVNITRTEADGPVMTATFQLEGQEFFALSGGPRVKFTEAISLFVDCKTQEEVDELWEKLSEGGEKQMCGWLKDKYGLFWQITPTMLTKLIADKDSDKVNRVMTAMMKMVKLDIKKLKAAAKGK